MRTTRLATPAGEFSLRAAAPGPEGYGIDLAEPAGATAESLLADPASLLAAEPLAYRLGLAPGDEFWLPTASGLQRFVIAGIYRDYNTAGSELVMSLATYRRNFDDTGLTSIGVHIEPGVDESSITAALRDAFGPERRARIRSTGMIRDLSLLIFDRTFRITEVLRLLAGIVAFLGVLSAVMALQLEREREFAVLRSLGMSIRQLFGQNLAQTSLLGFAAGLAALPLGTALAWLLVHVVNRRSFGWSIDFEIAPASLLAGLAMAVTAAVLAGIYPALVGARADMGLAWRDD
jgi:putative ABC transport system permease protein